MHFDRAGAHNTEETLKIAMQAAEERGIPYVVVASTKGDTGLQAAVLLQGTGISLIVVTHNTGFSEEGRQEFDEAKRAEIEELGGTVYTGDHGPSGTRHGHPFSAGLLAAGPGGQYAEDARSRDKGMRGDCRHGS